MKFDIKKYLPSILKTAVISGSIIFTLWLIWISGITTFLLEDKKPKSSIDEGKYILNKLTDDYEEFLKARRESLDKEAKFLLSEQGINKTLSEKQAIARRLQIIENEKKILNDEFQKNLIRKAELETNILSLESTLALSDKEISLLNEEYNNLYSEKEKTESYWRNYINEIFSFFSDRQNDPDKKNEIREKFKTNNGRNFIKDEFSSLFSKVEKQFYILTDNKNKEKNILNENINLEATIKEHEQTLQYYDKFSDVIKKFQNMLVYYNNANIAFKQKNFIKSSSEYKKVIKELEEINASYEGLITSEKELQNIIARKHIDAGLALMKSKHFSRASDTFKLALKDAPLSDYTDEAMSYIFKIAFQYKDVERIAKANLSAKLIMDRAKNYLRSKKYKEALKEYYNVAANYPISDYAESAGDKSNEIKEILLQEKLNNFTGVLKKNFNNDYRKFESIYFSGNMEKARNYYFEALQSNFGDYSKNTIEKFKEVEDKYIESLLKNFENQLIALKITETAKSEAPVKEKNSFMDSLFGKNEKKENQITEPKYTVLKSVMLKADGIGGKDAYELIQAAFGEGVVRTPDISTENNERVHTTLKHITEGIDSEIGNYFKFIVHRDMDKINLNNNKTANNNRIRLEKNSPKDTLAGLGESVKYTWKFNINKDMTVSKEMTLLFEIKSIPNNSESLNFGIITLEAVKKNNEKDVLQIVYRPEKEKQVLKEINWNDVKGKWITAECIISYKDKGFLYLDLKDSAGNDILSYESSDIKMWKDGAELFRPIWGIYRRLDDIKNLRTNEESVFYADMGIQKIKLNESKAAKAEIDVKEKTAEAFKENFDSTPIGQLPKDWNIVIADPDIFAGIVDSKTIKPYSMPNSLKLFDGSENNASVIRKEAGSHDYGQVKFYYYPESKSNSEIFFTVKNQERKNLINIDFNDEEIIIANINNQRSTVGFYKINEWNEVLIKYDSTSGFYTLQCNGKNLGKFRLLEKSTPYSIQFQGGLFNQAAGKQSKGINVYLDDIEFTANSEKITK